MPAQGWPTSVSSYYTTDIGLTCEMTCIASKEHSLVDARPDQSANVSNCMTGNVEDIQTPITEEIQSLETTNDESVGEFHLNHIPTLKSAGPEGARALRWIARAESLFETRSDYQVGAVGESRRVTTMIVMPAWLVSKRRLTDSWRSSRGEPVR